MKLTELTTRSTSFTFAVSGLLDVRMRQDSSCSWFIGCCSSFVGVLVSIFSLEALSPPLSPLPFFPLFYQCGRCLFFSFRVEAHGWVAWICQPCEWSASGSWLPIVEAPGCLRHLTSTLRGSC